MFAGQMIAGGSAPLIVKVLVSPSTIRSGVPVVVLSVRSTRLVAVKFALVKSSVLELALPALAGGLAAIGGGSILLRRKTAR